MRKLILAVDQGTTGTRCYLFRPDGSVAASAYREFTQFFPKPGWVEHDAEEIWRTVETTLRAALKAARATRRDIAAIGITNQRETAVVWDAATGRPIHRAVVWQCRRTAARCDALKKRGLEPVFRRKTGLVLDAYFSATKVEWILDHVRGARAKARAGRLRLGTIDSWLIWKLTGGVVHATDYTNASRTLLFDIRSKRWDPELCRLLRVPPSMLPEVRPSAGDFGATPDGIPIRGVAGDQQAALFGQGCHAPGTLKNTYGTGCFLLLNLGPRFKLSRHKLLTTLACDGRGRPVYALEGAVFVGGAAVQWVRDGLGLLTGAAESERVARSVPDAGGVYFVPAFVGLGAPYWDPAARGAILGLTRGTTRAHLVRAALESMAYQTRDVVEAMAADAGKRIRELRVDGGASANDLLMRFQADLLGAVVRRPAMVETTALGAAWLAGLGAGLRFTPRPGRTFRPKMAARRRAALWAGWRDAVERVRTR